MPKMKEAINNAGFLFVSDLNIYVVIPMVKDANYLF